MHLQGPRQIDTHRLSLRPISIRDAVFFFRLHGDPAVRRYLGGAVPQRDRIARLVGHLRGAVPDHAWVVRPRSGAPALGLIELGLHKDGLDHEISYQFAPEAWGQGFATEAVGAVIEHGLRNAGLARIIAETQGANAASCRLLERLGLREVGRLDRFGAEQVIYATAVIPPDGSPR